MFTLEQLTKMTNKEIKEILREEKLVMSGNKEVLIARIIAHQEKEDKERHEHDVMLTHGAQIHSQEFEKIMGVFLEWCGKEGFRVHKYGKSGCSFETVDVNEIPNQRLANILAQERANWLKSRVDELFY